MKWVYEHRVLLAVLLLVAIILSAAPFLSKMTVDDLISYSPTSPFLAALLLLAIYCIKSVVMVIPIAVLYISAGILFTPLGAIAITFLGAFCEAGIGYFLGKKMGSEKVRELVEKNERAAQFFYLQEQNNVSACFVARILPIPFDLVSIFYGASGMGFLRYTVFSLLGLCHFYSQLFWRVQLFSTHYLLSI